MKATFVELPAFSRHRLNYLDDIAFQALQNALMQNPEAGARIERCGGLRKLRFADISRQKGKSGGLRIIYYWWASGQQFWLFTLYNKNEMNDLDEAQKRALNTLIKQELEHRT